MLGPHAMRRGNSVGPDQPASNVQVARVGARLIAVWPAGESSLRIQQLADDGAPTGDPRMLAAEGAPALFSFISHGSEPLALLQSHHRCHRDNGARCIDSWWIAEDGTAGPKHEQFLGHTNNNLDEYAVIPVPDGVLAGKTFDDTRQGYAHMACRYAEPGVSPRSCPIVMPPATLDLYSSGPAQTVVVTTLLESRDRAQHETFVPLADGDLRGALHFFRDQKDGQHSVLRLVGRAPVVLAGFPTPNDYDAVTAELDARAGTVEFLYTAGGQTRLHRHRLDGTQVLPPAEPTPGLSPLADTVVASLFVHGRDIKMQRTLAGGPPVGEPLQLATAIREPIRFDSMHTIVWDRGRFVTLYAVPARKAWTIMARTIGCAP